MTWFKFFEDSFRRVRLFIVVISDITSYVIHINRLPIVIHRVTLVGFIRTLQDNSVVNAGKCPAVPAALLPKNFNSIFLQEIFSPFARNFSHHHSFCMLIVKWFFDVGNLK